MQNFSVKQLRFMDFVEQTWHAASGTVPSKELCIQKIPGLTGSDYDEYIKNPRIRDHLREVRGIELSQPLAGDALSPEQLVVCNTLLNLSDTRSTRKKLQDLGISPSKWDTWKRDPAVQSYLRAKAEGTLTDNLHEAHMGLVDAASRGDVKAIQLYYEITGRWSSKTVGELNVEFLLMKIIEILSKHVTDPQMLANISDDLLALAPSKQGQTAISSGPAVIDSTPVASPISANSLGF